MNKYTNNHKEKDVMIKLDYKIEEIGTVTGGGGGGGGR